MRAEHSFDGPRSMPSPGKDLERMICPPLVASFVGALMMICCAGVMWGAAGVIFTLGAIIFAFGCNGVVIVSNVVLARKERGRL